MKGLFVVFEGIDGSGKTTAIQKLQKLLEAQGLHAKALREPTEKTDASREIRRILRTSPTIDAHITQELLDLFLIDRLWDIEHQIKPALELGMVVLLDRYFFSTAAYQALNNAECEHILSNYFGDTRILLPNLLFFLDIPIELALERLALRGNPDVFENEARLKKIMQRYEKVFEYLQNHKIPIPVEKKSGALSDDDIYWISRSIADKYAKINP
ncbi:MAG: Thymidylate kinase [Turneriella sp.]|nr:Thymidylate kinase [Turneriella sp.]